MRSHHRSSPDVHHSGPFIETNLTAVTYTRLLVDNRKLCGPQKFPELANADRTFFMCEDTISDMRPSDEMQLPK